MHPKDREAYRRNYDAIEWKPRPEREVAPIVHKRSDLPAPMVSIDTMDPVRSMADGKVYTSKSAIRATYRADGNPQGVTYEEVGNDPAWKRQERPQPKSDPKAVQDAILKADARVRRGEKPKGRA